MMKEKLTILNEHGIKKQKLSKREREVMNLIAKGMPPRQIAVELAINTKTVNTYRARILKKLNLQSTGEIVRYAMMGEIINNAQDFTQTIESYISEPLFEQRK